MLEIGGERLEADFDIMTIIEKNKKLRHQIDIIKKKLNLEGDPAFDKLDPRNIIDVTTDECETHEVQENQ